MTSGKDPYIRTKALIGEDAAERLRQARIAVFGIGCVGGYVVEALARSGVGTLDLIDHDDVDFTNLNRQIIALRSTIGRRKTDVFAERIHDIDPSIAVNTYPIFYLPETRAEFPFEQFDYIVDAIDTVSAKLDIICAAKELGIPVISAMGCGSRLDPAKLMITDVYKTQGDPLAKVMRRELKKRNIRSLKVVYSAEPPIKPLIDLREEGSVRRSVPGSSPFVPAAAGLLIASAVCRDIIAG